MIFRKHFFIVAIAMLCSLQNAQAMLKLKPFLLSMLRRQQSMSTSPARRYPSDIQNFSSVPDRRDKLNCTKNKNSLDNYTSFLFPTFFPYPKKLDHTTFKSKKLNTTIEELTYKSTLTKNDSDTNITQLSNESYMSLNKTFKNLPKDLQKTMIEIIAVEICNNRHKDYKSPTSIPIFGDILDDAIKVIATPDLLNMTLKEVEKNGVEDSLKSLQPGLVPHFHKIIHHLCKIKKTFHGKKYSSETRYNAPEVYGIILTLEHSWTKSFIDNLKQNLNPARKKLKK